MPDLSGFPLLDEALRRWLARTPRSEAEVQLLAEFEHGRSVTAAHLAGENALRALQDSVGTALFEGKTLREWLDSDWEQIAAKYGKSGATHSAYEDLVFRQNVGDAQNAGKYAEVFSPEWIDAEPFWMYLAIDDARTRPEHHALDGRVFRKDDPFSRKYLPKLGFGCRCSTRFLTRKQVQAENLTVMSGLEIPRLSYKGVVIGAPPDGWNVDRLEQLVPEFMRRAA